MMPIQLTLNQHGFELYRSIYTSFFFPINIVGPWYLQFPMRRFNQPLLENSIFIFPTAFSQPWMPNHVWKVQFSVYGWLNPLMQTGNCRVKSYTRIFDCADQHSNPHTMYSQEDLKDIPAKTIRFFRCHFLSPT